MFWVQGTTICNKTKQHSASKFNTFVIPAFVNPGAVESLNELNPRDTWFCALGCHRVSMSSPCSLVAVRCVSAMDDRIIGDEDIRSVDDGLASQEQEHIIEGYTSKRTTDRCNDGAPDPIVAKRTCRFVSMNA